jgi:hypothetical protein
MSNKTANQAATEQTLAVPSDWEKWERIFRAKMEQNELLDYLNGDAELMTKPEMTATPPIYPTLAALRAKNPRQESQDTQTEGGEASQQASATISSTEKAALKAWKEEFSNEISYFNTVMNFHRNQLALYDSERKRLDEITKWMHSSISNDLKTVCLGEGIDIRTGYQNLKGFFGRTTMTVAHELGERYKKHMKQFPQWPKDINTWVTEWLTIMQKGKEYNLSFATEITNWTQQFFETFYKADPAWITTLRTMYSGRIEEGSVTYLEFSKQLQEHTRLKSIATSRGGFQRGAFNANHDHEERTDDEGQEGGDIGNNRRGNNGSQRGRGGYRGRRGNKNFQPARSSSGPACIGCGLYHPVIYCFYLFPFLAPEGFEPNPTRVEITKKNLQDKRIRDEVEEIRKKFASLRFDNPKKMNKKDKEDDSLI